MNKYGNRKIEFDGIAFDSVAESNYYHQLKWLKNQKQIKDFELQPKFLLQESFKKNGKTFRKIEYTADFKVIGLDGSIEIVDIKGGPTDQVFNLKRKLFEKRYSYNLVILRHVKKLGGWVTDEQYKKYKRTGKIDGIKGDAKQ